MKVFRVFASSAAIVVTLVGAGCGGAAEEKGDILAMSQMRAPVPDVLSIKDYSRDKPGLAAAEFRARNADFSESRHTIAVFNVMAMEHESMIAQARIELKNGKSVVLDSDGSETGKERVQEAGNALAGFGGKLSGVVITEVEKEVYITTPLVIDQPKGAWPKSSANEFEMTAGGNSIEKIFPGLNSRR